MIVFGTDDWYIFSENRRDRRSKRIVESDLSKPNCKLRCQGLRTVPIDTVRLSGCSYALTIPNTARNLGISTTCTPRTHTLPATLTIKAQAAAQRDTAVMGGTVLLKDKKHNRQRQKAII